MIELILKHTYACSGGLLIGWWRTTRISQTCLGQMWLNQLITTCMMTAPTPRTRLSPQTSPVWAPTPRYLNPTKYYSPKDPSLPCQVPLCHQQTSNESPLVITFKLVWAVIGRLKYIPVICLRVRKLWTIIYVCVNVILYQFTCTLPYFTLL